MKNKKIIGRIETISIIDLNLFDLDAKIDTGADSSAIHCDKILIDKEKNLVSFTLLDEIHESYHGKRITLPLYKIKKVKSSNGQIQLRPSVEVVVEFFGEKYQSVISLTDRADMKFPMLIGRNFLNGKFVVDVEQQYLINKHI